MITNVHPVVPVVYMEAPFRLRFFLEVICFFTLFKRAREINRRSHWLFSMEATIAPWLSFYFLLATHRNYLQAKHTVLPGCSGRCGMWGFRGSRAQPEHPPIGTDLVSSCQAVYFNLGTGGSINTVFKHLAFACLPVHG